MAAKRHKRDERKIRIDMLLNPYLRFLRLFAAIVLRKL